LPPCTPNSAAPNALAIASFAGGAGLFDHHHLSARPASRRKISSAAARGRGAREARRGELPLQSGPNQLIAEGTDWRFLNELKRELKA
jgi:hypothetical protein